MFKSFLKVNLLIGFTLCFANLYAQDDNKLIYGANIGVKFAHKYNALRYSGAYKNQLMNYFTNPNTYQIIRTQFLDNKDFNFFEYSELYRYRPAYIFGVMFGYKTSPTLSFDADLNFSRLTAITGYTLTIIDPGNTTSQDIYENGFISGKETRFNGRINMNFMSEPDKLQYVFGLSGIINSWRMEDNSVELRGSIITNLYSQFNPNNGFTIQVRGTNFAYGVNLGINYQYSEAIAVQILYQPYIGRAEYFNTKLEIENAGDAYVKPKFRLEHDLVMRFIW